MLSFLSVPSSSQDLIKDCFDLKINTQHLHLSLFNICNFCVHGGADGGCVIGWINELLVFGI